MHIGGNPFANAQWIPVLDICEINCDVDKEICVENDDLEQKCSKLPDACVKLWEVHRAALKRKVLRDGILFSDSLNIGGGSKGVRSKFRGPTAPKGRWN
ncbi:hypothetical protein L596_024103 [Steinernema carpocapsae]|uniref:Uncharacterized protein n=1 Tax=Steinernema carpocapsae TaxID=34508 RepID=A0A4U5MFQ4_STECR|nr:hypothetical protein L596_024103 [Steinernema carpocapsae]